MANELAGNIEKAEQWAAKVKLADASFKPGHFIASFPLGDDHTRAVAVLSMERLGFS